MTKFINTKQQQATAIERISELMDRDPMPGSPEENELESLARIVETYEKKTIRRHLPEPVEAIRFRMDQQGSNNVEE